MNEYLIIMIVYPCCWQIEETAQREARIKERSKSISVLREAERSEVLRSSAAKLSQGGDDIADREKEDMERKGRSDILRRQRSQVSQQYLKNNKVLSFLY